MVMLWVSTRLLLAKWQRVLRFLMLVLSGRWRVDFAPLFEGPLTPTLRAKILASGVTRERAMKRALRTKKSSTSRLVRAVKTRTKIRLPRRKSWLMLARMPLRTVVLPLCAAAARRRKKFPSLHFLNQALRDVYEGH